MIEMVIMKKIRHIMQKETMPTMIMPVAVVVATGAVRDRFVSLLFLSFLLSPLLFSTFRVRLYPPPLSQFSD